jgi:DUF4097 and DUF4098 domain-containing protein YvlB
MSWIYTILFTGLVLSSQEGTASKSQTPFVDNTAVHATRVDETEKFEQTYPLNANGRVNVSNVNGSVVVEAWDRNEVKLSYTKVADSKDRLADVEVKVDSRADYFSVETDYNNWKKDKGSDWRSGRLNVEIRMMVPRGAVLNEIETVNGSVSVSNFTSITRVSAVNGSVTAINLRGTAKLSTVNGEVAADFDRLEAGTKISLDTVNGKVNLVIPSDSNATVRADSLNGTITNDFGLPVRKGKYIGRDLYGKIGNGEVQIRLDSVNGNLSVARKADGKTLSPAVNLLPQKEKGDDNWDKDDDNDNESMRSSKLDKDIAKAVKESQKASTKAVVDAQAAISKIQPEIAKITTESISRSAEAITRAAEILNSRDVQRELERAQVVQRNAITRLGDINFSGVGQRVEKKSGVFVMKGVPKVTVKADGCSVNIRGWDRSEVQYRVTQFADARNRTPLDIRENHTDSTVDIVVENAEGRGGSRSFLSGAARVRVEIYVPRKANLKINADGELRVEGVTGDVELTGSDEPINVRDVDGKLRVTNSDGLVRVIGFNGEVDSRTADGEVYLEGQFSRINGNANDGSFFLTVPENPNADIKANIEALTIENLRIPTSVSEGHWRFGAGGPKYTFTVADGCVTVRNATSLTQ